MADHVVVDDLPVSILLGGEIQRTTPDATLYEVAAIMARNDIGALVVNDGDDEATAVVSERDVIRALADLKNPAETRVYHVASTRLLWCDVEAPIGEVATKMVQAYVRHVLVEEDGELVGIVSLRDILGAYTSYRE